MNNSEISKSNFEKLCQEIRKGKVILLVGAGFSAYAGYFTGDPLCTHLKSIIIQEFGDEITSNDLSEVASLFILKKGRKSLEEELIRIYDAPPKNFLIHELLSKINYFPIIITTNYDTLIEQVYGEKIYTITDDIFFPKTPKDLDNLILLKIHGDISCPSKMVISKEDYLSFDENTILWAKLKTICSEYSVLFMGYSLRDSNVSTLLNNIFLRLGNHKNPYYLISKNIDPEKQDLLTESRIIGIEMTNEEAITQIFQSITRNSMLKMLKNPSEISKIHPLLVKSGAQIHYTMSGKTCEHLSIGPEKNNRPIGIEGSIKVNGNNKEILERFIACINGETVSPITLSKNFVDIEFIANIKELNLIYIKTDSEFKLENITIIPHPSGISIVDISVDSLPYRLRDCSCRFFLGKKEEQIKISHQFIEITFNNQRERESTANISICPPHSVYNGHNIFSIITKWINGEQLTIIPKESGQVGFISSPTIVNDEFKRNISDLDKLYSYLHEIEEKNHIRINIPDRIKKEDLERISIVHAILLKQSVNVEDISLDLENIFDYSALKKITGLKSTETTSIQINLPIKIFDSSFNMDFILVIGRDDLQHEQKVLEEIKFKKKINRLVFSNNSGRLCLLPTKAP